MRVLEFPALRQEKGIGFSKSQIARRVAAGTFPRPIKIGTNRNAWVEAELDAWLGSLVISRDEADS